MAPLNAPAPSESPLGRSGATALMRAAFREDWPAVELLLPESDLNAVAAGGETALCLALARPASLARMDILRGLLALPDLDARSPRGSSPLAIAIENNDVEAVGFLLTRFNPNVAIDSRGRTGLMFAAHNAGFAVLSLLLPHCDATIASRLPAPFNGANHTTTSAFDLALRRCDIDGDTRLADAIGARLIRFCRAQTPSFRAGRSEARESEKATQSRANACQAAWSTV